MEEFGISLKTIHDKLCERDIPHRDPCDTFLPVDEYMVYQIEIDDMFSKMGNIDENDIKNEEEIYVMFQDVFSCMRDTGMTDMYLLILFPEDYKKDNETKTVDNIARKYIDTLLDIAPQNNEKRMLLFMKERVSNFIRVASLRAGHIQKDNERYGDMLDLLEEMMNSIYFLKGTYEGDMCGDVKRILAKKEAERANIKYVENDDWDFEK